MPDAAKPVVARSMQALLPDATDLALAGSVPQRLTVDGVWSLLEYPVVTSTNLVAASLAAWTAVRADVQTAGRGRFERKWVSNAGGLWLSAVLPGGVCSRAGLVLPLALGLAVCEVLSTFRLAGLRMRWPNDLLVGHQKIAGLLVDRFSPDRVVLGIGINLTNQPESLDPALSGQTARLADLVAPAPRPRELASLVLASLRAIWQELEAGGPQALLPRINSLWHGPTLVELELDHLATRGEFTRVDLLGRLELRLPGGGSRFFEPREVKHLREIRHENS